MSDDNQSGRSYRRGAIMGLTLAEAFILIAFALLLLFAFWQWEKANENAVKLQAIDELADAGGTIGECIRSFEISNELEDFGIDANDVPAMAQTMQSFRQKGIGLGDLNEMAEGLALPAGSPEELKEKWRFIDQDDVRRLLDSVSSLPSDMQRDLADMVENEDAQATLKEMAILEELVQSGQEVADLIASSELAQTIQDSGMEFEDLLATAKIKQALDQSGRTIEDLIKMSESFQKAGRSLADIADKIEQAQGQEQALIAALRNELGDIVSNAGGNIDDTGAIILPDSILFERGKAEITPVLGQFLEEACEPWLTVLKNSGVEIAEVKIEGHASSEWAGSTDPFQAYLRNLDLSQGRSHEVLRECLGIVKDPDIREWARKHMIAVGYSSVRPVMRNGEEDREASRRVVFSVAPDRESLIDAIETEAKTATSDGSKIGN